MQQAVHLSHHVDWHKTLGQPWHSLILAVVGIVFALLATQDWQATAARMAGTVEVEGIVIDYAVRDGRHYPVLQYYDQFDQLYTVQSTVGLAETEVRAYATMSVIYPEASPANGEVTSFWDVWMSTIRNGILALVFLAGALFLWAVRAEIYTLDGKKH